jgi:hypothetical protein
MTETTNVPESKWSRLTAGAEPDFDPSGRPVLNLRVGDTPIKVGLTRDTIASRSESREIAQVLLLIRLREELRKNPYKASQNDIHDDLRLFGELQQNRAELSAPVVGTY